MIRRTMVRTAPLVLLAVFATGCANKAKQRITMLEQNNSDLTERLNRAMSELDAAGRQRDELDQQLLVAYRDVDDCRAQLAEAPELEEAAPGWTAVPGGAMIAIEGSVLFAPGKMVVREEAKSALDTITKTINSEYGDKDIIVFGHTDDRPIRKSGWRDNWQLSTERSLAVVRYIQDHGVRLDRLIAAGCGEHRPRVDNSSEANRATNRRVEIFALNSHAMAGGP